MFVVDTEGFFFLKREVDSEGIREYTVKEGTRCSAHL